ncbi:hypothetical protein Q31b_49290 [Novipirellula aureliae]|uniref:Uncharacterized protein n=1 Tax=Novipirellula aureliae TaxID=2527966 RepID=A0A5C6DIV5_9BACT|nr:hypothetical protein [Novipirellula aureliae]TWU36648.1 hypothetical protein Q31b_49290 [Novipirellula aureliae]
MTRRKKPGGNKRKRRRPPSSNPKPPVGSQTAALDSGVPLWLDEQGMHAVVPGTPDSDVFERMTEIYQQKIRESPMWDQMVDEFGLEKAEQLLKQCRAEPG